MALTYRVLTTIAEFHQAGDLEAVIWGANTREIVPSSMMRVIALNGGLVVGAFDGTDMIGMSMAFTGVRGGQVILWSHMTGVHAEYQGRDVGFTLKQFQRTWALNRGYDEIRWTFDPLQRGNANFNLHRLGAVANLYHDDFYGVMEDDINPQTPSDRLEVVWRLKDARVAALASGQMQMPTLAVTDEAIVLSPSADGMPNDRKSIEQTGDTCFIEIPMSITALSKSNRNAAAEWRYALRRGLQAAFSRGYVAIDFIPTAYSGAYVLTRTL